MILTTKRKMNAISYTRVSTRNQSNFGASLDEQKNRIALYARDNNFNICTTLSDVMSGRSKSNLDNLDFARINNILVTDVTRFCRDVKMGINRIKKMVAKNVTIHFIREALIITKAVMDDVNHDTYKILLHCLNMAERESKLLGTRVKNVTAYKRSRGEHTGGSVPYGLKLVNIQTINDYGQNVVLKKYTIDENVIMVLRLIDLCRDPFNTIDVTEALRVVLKRPVILDADVREFLEYLEPYGMTNSQMCQLFNHYNILYKGNEFKTYNFRSIKSEQDIRNRVNLSLEEKLEITRSAMEDINIRSPKRHRRNI